MAVYAGSRKIGAVFAGARPIKEVWAGSRLVWASKTWDWVDDFERTTIGTGWTGSGGQISGTSPNRYLQKNTTAGSADYWTSQQFRSDNIEVEAVLGPIMDSAQKAAVLIGSTAQNIYVEFSQSSGIIGDYNGSAWTTRANFGALPWAQGDRLRVLRWGNDVWLYRNDEYVASAVSSVAKGTAFRRVGLSVKMARNIINWFGPTFDAVRISAY